MSPFYRTLLAGACLLISEHALANGWSGKVGVGLIATSGNSESSTFNLDLGLSHKQAAWTNQISAKAIQARSQVEDASSGGLSKRTTSERYTLSLRTSFDITETDFVFAQLNMEKDLFGAVRERTSQTLGYGRRLLHTPAHKLDLEVGAGARQLLAQGDAARRESRAVGRGGLKYVWQISASSRFSQAFSVETGKGNTYSEALSELKLAVIGGVFANLGFTVKNNSEVPAGTVRTDTISSVSLSYEF